MFAELIGDHQSERRELANALSSDLERNIQQSQCHQSHRVGVLLVVRVEERDEYSQQFLDRGDSERCNLA